MKKRRLQNRQQRRVRILRRRNARAVEHLESRLLLDSDVVFKGGILTVTDKSGGNLGEDVSFSKDKAGAVVVQSSNGFVYYDGTKDGCFPANVKGVQVYGSVNPVNGDRLDLTGINAVAGYNIARQSFKTILVVGNGGPDKVFLGEFGETYVGGPQGSTVYGSVKYTDGDTIAGNGGPDRIFGGDGPDFITTGDGGTGLLPGTAIIEGGGGNDRIAAGNILSKIDGGDGNDDIWVENGGYSAEEKGDPGYTLLGGNGSDTLFGSPHRDSIVGGSGDDYINGMGNTGGGIDTLSGGSGNNWLYFNKGIRYFPPFPPGIANDYGPAEGNHAHVGQLRFLRKSGATLPAQNGTTTVYVGAKFDLKAFGLRIPQPDPQETITSVSYYLDTNGFEFDEENGDYVQTEEPNGKLDQWNPGDRFLGTFAPDGKAPVDTTGWDPGTYTFFAIADSSNGFQGDYATGTITVKDPNVAINAILPQTQEMQTSAPGIFEVTRDGPTDNSLTVNYKLSGTATDSTDYSTLSGSVTIAAGALAAPIDVEPLDDGDGDDSQVSESVVATLTADPNVYNIDPSGPSATVTIDEESPPTVTITGSGAAVEKGLSGQFTVSRTGPVDSSLTVSLASGGTAQAGVDYQSLPSSVTIPAGSRTAPVVVNALDDGTSGDLSSANVTETIQPSSAYTIGSPNSASVPIEEEGFTTVTIAATTTSTTEGSSAPGVFTVARAAPYTQALTVTYTLGGSATNGVDYQSLSGTVTIPAGAPSAPIYVAPLDDGDSDDSLTSEAVVATLQPGTGYQVGTPASDTVTINEEAKTTVTIAATANAIETSGTAGSFTVTRTGPTTAPLNVTFSLGGSAVAGTDYSSPGTSVTIPAGQASATITIAPIDDGQTEASKTVTATLVDEPGVYAVGTPSAAQIGIDEDGTETVNLSATAPSTQETGNLPGVITVTRTGPTTSALTVNYQTQGTAQSGVDYQFLSGTVTIPAGQVSADIDIVPLDDESKSDESQGDVAGVQLTYGSGYQIGNQSSASVTIVEDAPPTITVTPAVPIAVEGGVNGEFFVTRTGATTAAISIGYQVSGTALAGQDYASLSGSVTIPAGSSQAAIDVQALEDSNESNQQPETVTVNLSQAQQGQYILGSPASATVTVAEQPIPTVTIAGGPDAVEEGAGGEFTVTRTGPFTAPLAVSYTVGGSAVAGGDYQALSGTVTIPAGSNSAVVAVTPLDDGATDDPPQSQSEQVTLTLSTSTSYVVGNASTAMLGIDEEPPPSVTIVADSDATEAGDSGEFDVVRTGPDDAPLTVTYTLGGSATAGTDYTALTGTVTIPAGGDDATISVDPLDDGDGDDGTSPPAQTVVATLSTSASYTIGAQNTATVNINEEPPPVVTIAADADATEDGDSGQFTVSRTGPTDDPLTVNYTVGGTAVAGTDYTSIGGSVTIAAGDSSADITVAPLDDVSDDGQTSESVNVTLSSSASYTLGDAVNATVNINEEPPPTVSIYETSGPVDELGSWPGEFTVYRDGPTDGALVVNYTLSGAAVNGTDYQSLSGTVTIPDGSSTATIDFMPLDDGADDPGVVSKDVVATLSTSSAYTIDPEAGSDTVTINEDPVVTIAATAATTAEGSGTPGMFTVSRTGSTDEPLLVDYTTGGSAISGTDYTALSGSVVIPIGASSATIEVDPIDDVTDDSNPSETVTATLVADSDYDVGSPNTATVTINEEPIVTVVATTPTTVEDGGSPGVFTITRTGPTIAAVDVAFTLGGSAVSGTDFTSVGGSVTIPVGQSSATVSIAPIDDLTDDGNPSETVVLTLSTAAAYDIGTPASDTVTIDEEPPPTVTISATTPTTVEDGGTPGAFTVSRTGPTDGALSVSYSLGGSAVNGTDYASLSGSVTIPDGQASATFDVSPLDDLTDDAQASESVVATLSASAGYLVGTPNQATVTIDEEPPPTVTIAATTDATAELSSSPGVFTVTRSGPTDGALAVSYQMSGTAVNGTDYTSLSGSVTIPDGQASATFYVSPLDDGDGDDSGSSETATATIAASPAYTVGAANQASVTIYEEPTVTIVATTATTVEDGGSSGLFTVTRTGLTTAALTVNFTLGGSATIGSDFTDPGGSVTIAAGQTSSTIPIAPLDDGDGDDSLGSQNVVATLSGSSSYNVGAANQATVTIDEESPPTVTIAATTPTTQETGASPGVFTVSRTGPTDDPLTVSYSTSGTASAGSDYTALSGSVTIPIGQSSATIDVSPIDDGDGDDTTASATVTATLASSAGYTIGSANSATVTIDEDLLPTVTISATTPSVAEVGGGSGTFTVSLSAAASNNITVSYATTGTAVAGSDYQALSGSVLVPAGQTSATISVTPIDDGDGDDDGSSASVTATLQNSSSYIVGSANTATVSITEDVSAPTATISASTATTTEGGPSPGAFTVSLSSAPASSVTVNYSLSGTATNGTDYQTLSGQVTISAGQTSATIQVTPLDDGNGDDNLQSEAVTATLTSGTGYTIGSPSAATVTIDEESGGSGPSVSISAQSSSMAETGGVGDEFYLQLSSAPASSITVQYSLSGTAHNGVDYQTLSGSVTVPAGQSFAVIPVTPIDDGDGDDNQTSESLTATIISGSGYSVGSPASATITIFEESQGGPPQVLDRPPQTADATTPTITADDAWALVPAAAARWLAAGIAPATVVGDLLGLRIVVTDLPDSGLGEANAASREIWLDANAAGYGWFVDRTPWSDEEFAAIIAPTERQAVAGSPALGEVDLLTVLMHEMGHLFGLPEAAGSDSTHDVMWETLGLSTRRDPDAADALAATAAAPSAAIESQSQLTPRDTIFERLGAGAREAAVAGVLPARRAFD